MRPVRGTLHLRYSGSYRMIASAITENGFPGPFIETTFQHSIILIFRKS